MIDTRSGVCVYLFSGRTDRGGYGQTNWRFIIIERCAVAAGEFPECPGYKNRHCGSYYYYCYQQGRAGWMEGVRWRSEPKEFTTIMYGRREEFGGRGGIYGGFFDWMSWKRMNWFRFISHLIQHRVNFQRGAFVRESTKRMHWQTIHLIFWIILKANKDTE